MRESLAVPLAASAFRVRLLRPDGRGAAADLAALPRGWCLAQFERAKRGADIAWFETLQDGRFGPTVALVGRLQGGAPLRRGGMAAAPAGTLTVLHVDWTLAERRLRRCMRTAGLSPAVARLAVSLFRCRDVRIAAAQAGVAYETAREYLQTARAAVGAENLQRLVSEMGRCLGHAGGEVVTTAPFLAAALGLTRRQLQIAELVSQGVTRRGVASLLGVSEAVVKKEIAIVFTAVGVVGVIGLARAMMELRLLAGAAVHIDACRPMPEPASAPPPAGLLPRSAATPLEPGSGLQPSVMA